MTDTGPRITLDDKYVATSGRVLISGVQALVRLMLDQRRFDARHGLDTRVFVSGYPGSPLGGLDTALGAAQRLLEPAGVVFTPGLNEELAATAVAGTQLLDLVPGRRHPGVVGFWYGKNPGLDRAADAIRHGNVAGTAPLGGAVAIIGDDPAAKSSTVPSSCEPMAASLGLPVFAPGSVAEVVEYGLHAVALSRASGLWTGLKIVADVADASATVEVGTAHLDLPVPDANARQRRFTLLGPAALDAEHDLLTRRLDVAREYARTCGLNRVVFSARRPRLGLLAAGTSFAVVERALADLGLDEGSLDALGIRLIRLGLPFPVAPADLRELTAGLEQVLVVEDKVPFLEDQLKAAFHRVPDAPVVLGRTDEQGRPLLPARGAVGADDLARALGGRLDRERLPAVATAHLDRLTARRSRIDLPVVSNRRTPYFCSGCPHSTSTKASDDTLVGVGIGCHVMVALDPAGRGRQVGITQMGGEGAQWVGLAPFTDDRHFVQNLGDGTFHHSGSLAIRAAVAAGVSMTYKLLYNDAVAMTGGQTPPGRLDVATLTHSLAAEGVARIVVTTDDVRRYRRVRLHPVATVRPREEITAAEAELAAVPGVTVLIHDDRCATEERRLRKRGKLPTPAEKVVINERACEGCGDCGEKSTCLSVLPVPTEFGRKTRVHQSSCNTDLTCTQGDCPSFLLVEPRGDRRRTVPDLPLALPEPIVRVGGPRGADDVLIRMPGIGGTGVVTVSAILQMAAHLDGRNAAGLEQVGLAQKGGPVVSDVRISAKPVRGALRASRGSLDVLLCLDVLGAADDAVLATARPGHTVAVINTDVVPTAAMVTGRAALPTRPTDAVARILAATDGAAAVSLDAQRLAEALFGDHMPTNMLLLGAAYQHGCLPVSAEAVEEAIRLNGAAVSTTLAAFRWGRAAVVDAERVAAAAGLVPFAPLPPDEALALRIADLTEYQDERYARRYAADVAELRAAATERVGPAEAVRLADTYARGLHKLMAYKDEYEVARLHLDAAERARVADEFGADARVSVLLHPPALRALGMKRKIRLRRTARPAFRTLYAARRLRGTRLDVFGYAQVRRVERELIEEYRAAARAAVVALRPEQVDAVQALLELPAAVTGYEEIKLARVAEFRAALAAGPVDG
ncbi:indolepyruvate ferredoxin oxidoreductase family protein [Sporichthya brevicatena]|uniref:Indolepyruvate ferredoxin oxidoreductase family protein n=1 Tax=Sporichthya brevicatena TaxID=171442 RepID=A0ABN1H7K4_9ACTN